MGKSYKMRRTAANGILAGLTVLGFLMSLLRAVVWVLDQIGRAETAKSLYDAGALFAMKDVTLNWGAIYFWIGGLSLSLLVALNWEIVAALWVIRRNARRRTWDEALTQAANWVSKESKVSRSFLYDTARQEAVRMIEGYARSGAITISGKFPESGVLVPISRKMWKHAALQARYSEGPYGKDIAETWLSDASNPKAVLMQGLMIDSLQFYGVIN